MLTRSWLLHNFRNIHDSAHSGTWSLAPPLPPAATWCWRLHNTTVVAAKKIHEVNVVKRVGRWKRQEKKEEKSTCQCGWSLSTDVLCAVPCLWSPRWPSCVALLLAVTVERPSAFISAPAFHSILEYLDTFHHVDSM